MALTRSRHRSGLGDSMYSSIASRWEGVVAAGAPRDGSAVRAEGTEEGPLLASVMPMVLTVRGDGDGA